ncbi:MAG: HAD family hydrolase [Alkalispirochaeta sp.]
MRVQTEPARRPELLLCDVGDTLIEWTGYDRDAGLDALVPLIDRRERYDRALLAREGELLDHDWEERAATSLLEFRQCDFLRTLFGAHGMRLLCSDDSLETLYWRSALTFQPESGVGDALERISAAGVRLGIISNTVFGPDAIACELASHRLLDRFDGPIITSARYGIRKPLPSIFRAALGLYDGEESTTWYVGNSVYHDVGGAHAAKLTAVWYNGDNEDIELTVGDPPDLTVFSWDELAREIESLGG